MLGALRPIAHVVQADLNRLRRRAVTVAICYTAAALMFAAAATLGGAAALIALIVLVIRPFLFWWTTQYVFTNRRIIIRTGIVARRGRDMPLSKVNDVSFDHSVWERMLNCGTLMIESAAENGQLIIENIPDVENVQREVYRLHDEDDAFRRARNSGIDPSPPTNES